MLRKFVPLIFLGLASCSLEVTDPQKTDQMENPETEQEESAHEPNPLKDICSYRKDKDKGCLKATISTTELSVGDIYYPLGVEQFVKSFDKDFAEAREANLGKKETLEFSRRQSLQKFYSNFNITVEGSHTTYPAYHVGLGNIQVNGMAVGYYNVLVSKEFDLQVLKNGDLVGYRCVILWAREFVDIQAGKETALPTPISEFELEVYEETCSGKAFAPKEKEKEEDEEDEGSEEDTEDTDTTSAPATGSGSESVSD